MSEEKNKIDILLEMAKKVSKRELPEQKFFEETKKVIVELFGENSLYMSKINKIGTFALPFVNLAGDLDQVEQDIINAENEWVKEVTSLVSEMNLALQHK